MKFNDNIRALREDKDLTQAELGKLLQMSQRKISRLENANTEPTTDEIIRYCKLFKVSADYILGIENNIG